METHRVIDDAEESFDNEENDVDDEETEEEQEANSEEESEEDNDVPDEETEEDQEANSEEESEEDNDVPDDNYDGSDKESVKDEDHKSDDEEGDDSNDDSNDEDGDGAKSSDEDACGADESEQEEEDVDEEGNSGWADAMAKVLAMGKNSEKPVSVLSKAKKDNEKKKKKPKTEGEQSGSSDDDEEESEKQLEPLSVRRARKLEIDSIGRKMPDVLERNAEKALSRIATKGVVQLFNAVRVRQKDMKTQLKEAGGSIRKQDKVYKDMDKSGFVQMLTGKPISKSSTKPPPAKKFKTQEDIKDEEDPSAPAWNILKDDYMMGAKMKDWDKESDGE